jgi:hypothetical protein
MSADKHRARDRAYAALRRLPSIAWGFGVSADHFSPKALRELCRLGMVRVVRGPRSIYRGCNRNRRNRVFSASPGGEE